MDARADQHFHRDAQPRQAEPWTQRTAAIRRILAAVLVFNVLTAVAKLGFGLFSNSVGMIADGVNSLMDAVSNIIEIIGISVASRPPDINHPYGHRRFETLTSLAVVLFMVLALEEILQRAWDHWRHATQPDVSAGSFVIMGASLAIVSATTLWTRLAGRRYGSSVLTSESKHLASDVLVSFSVIVGLVGVKLGFRQADVIIALVVAGVIAWAAWSIIRGTFLTLSDAAVVSNSEIDGVARSVVGVEGVHNIRTRGAEGVVWADMHIQVDPEMSVARAHDIASDVAARVEEEIGQRADVTVHVEPAYPEHLQAERGHRPEDT